MQSYLGLICVLLVKNNLNMRMMRFHYDHLISFTFMNQIFGPTNKMFKTFYVKQLETVRTHKLGFMRCTTLKSE